MITGLKSHSYTDKLSSVVILSLIGTVLVSLKLGCEHSWSLCYKKHVLVVVIAMLKCSSPFSYAHIAEQMESTVMISRPYSFRPDLSPKRSSILSAHLPYPQPVIEPHHICMWPCKATATHQVSHVYITYSKTNSYQRTSFLPILSSSCTSYFFDTLVSNISSFKPKLISGTTSCSVKLATQTHNKIKAQNL